MEIYTPELMSQFQNDKQHETIKIIDTDFLRKKATQTTHDETVYLRNYVQNNSNYILY